MRVFVFICWILVVPVTSKDTVPQQVHIALNGEPAGMVVQWVTLADTESSVVQYGYGKDELSFSTKGSSKHYVFPDPLPMYRSGQIHVVELSDLPLATRVYYRVGDANGGWSKVFSFVSEDPQKRPIRIATVGDIGHVDNSMMVVKRMETMHKASPFDLMLHPGDLSYANGNQTIWDLWGRQMESFSSEVPYMVATGNHEAISLFIPFQHRFTMPAKKSGSPRGNLYYSFDYSLVHVIALDSETLTYSHQFAQYKWLKNDLEKVDRTKTPWVILFWHSPWYSSNLKHPDSGAKMKKSYEELLVSMKVDLVLTGHVHAYERTHAVAFNEVNEKGPEYRTVGNGGNHEGLYDRWQTPAPAWSAHHEACFGFGIFEVHNATHGYWQMIRADNGTVADLSWVVRER